MSPILILVLLVILFGGGSTWYGARSGWGVYSFGPIIGLLLILLLLRLLGVF